MTGEVELRASDADREAVVERLATHGAAGRLDAAELEQRTAAALGARTVAELQALEADLPSAPAGASGARSPGLGRFRTYVPVISLLVVIWAVTGAGYFWPIWPALGWGVALLLPGSCSSSHKRRPSAPTT